jgi:DNA-binding protein HU-beta
MQQNTSFLCLRRFHGRARLAFAHESHSAQRLAHFALKELIKMAAKAAAPAKPKATKPITTKHLVATLAEQHQLTKKASQDMFDDLIAMITKHLKKGERVKIAGLGILQVRKRAARMGRNPATGEAIKIKASKKVAFRAAKDLKEAI